jgi:AcrR family transcriptional regulator
MQDDGPRPRGADISRASILRAAQQLFAVQGYATTGVRDIAQRAGVNSALVGRYFGSKAHLFRVALEDFLAVAPLLKPPERSEFGRHAVQLLVSADGAGPLAMMMLSMADPQARNISIELFQERVIRPVAQWLGEPDAEGRAARLNILWSGFLNCWRLLPLPALADDRLRPTLLWLEQATQAIMDEGAWLPIKNE